MRLKLVLLRFGLWLRLRLFLLVWVYDLVGVNPVVEFDAH